MWNEPGGRGVTGEAPDREAGRVRAAAGGRHPAAAEEGGQPYCVPPTAQGT